MGSVSRMNRVGICGDSFPLFRSIGVTLACECRQSEYKEQRNVSEKNETETETETSRGNQRLLVGWRVVTSNSTVATYKEKVKRECNIFQIINGLT